MVKIRWQVMLVGMACGLMGAGMRGAVSPVHAGPTNAVDLTLDASRIRHALRGGFGASWHAIETPIPITGTRSHGGSGWGGYPPAEDADAWRQIEQHADWLGFDFCRVEFEQRMYEPERRRFTWDTPELRILYRILDWCESRRVDVFLQQMWSNVAWNAFPEFQDDPVRRVHSGPKNMDDFAYGLASLVRHLVHEKKYRCIKWISITNEPRYDWSWWQRPPNEPMSLAEGLRAVRRALDAVGIAIPLSAPDWTDIPELKPREIDFDASIGAYDLHSYFARFDWGETKGYPLRVAEERLRAWHAWAKERDKPLFLTEIGSMTFGWSGADPGPSTFEAALKDTQLVVRGLNVGVEGFNRWSFINRGDLDGQWQMIETWDPAAKRLLKTYSPKPNPYFMFGLISRMTAKQSRLVETAVEGGRMQGLARVFSAGLLSPRNQLTWLVINDAPEPWSARVRANHLTGTQLFRYQMTQALKDQPGLTIEPVRVAEIRQGQVDFEEPLPPMSLTIYSTYRLPHAERGIIAE